MPADKLPIEDERWPLLQKAELQIVSKGRSIAWTLQSSNVIVPVVCAFFCLLFFSFAFLRPDNSTKTPHHNVAPERGFLPSKIPDNFTRKSRQLHKKSSTTLSASYEASTDQPEGWKCRPSTSKAAVAAIGSSLQGGCCALAVQTKNQSVVPQHPFPKAILPPQCFESSRCHGGLKIHLYPGKSSDWSNQPENYRFHDDDQEPTVSDSAYRDKKQVQSRWDINRSPPLRYIDLLQYIRQSRFYTADPNEACLFMPTFIHSCFTGEKDDFDGFPVDWEDRLRQLPLFSNAASSWGKQHLLWDWCDTPDRSIAHRKPGDVDCPIFVKSGFHLSKYRCGHDVSFPLFGTTTFDSSFRKVETRNQRPILASFKGAIWGPKNKRESDPWGPMGAIRNELRHLHDGKDIIVALECIDDFAEPWGKYDRQGADSWCDDFDMHLDDFDWKELAVNSTFSLVPAGWGLHSKRLIEVMSAGSIPVIVADGWVLPFSEVLDWNRFSVIVAESEVLNIPQLLRSLEPAVIANMRDEMLRVYDMYFSSIPRAVGTLLEILEQRLAPKDQDGGAIEHLKRVRTSLQQRQ